MWVDALVLTLIGLLAAVGASRGARESGFRLAGLVLAYVGASRLALALGSPVAAALGLPTWVGAVLLGTLVFVLLGLVAGALARGVGRREREASDGLQGGSRALGALLGALRGVLLALPLLWVADFAAGASSLLGERLPLRDLQGARLPTLSGALVDAGAQLLLDPANPRDRLETRLLAHPGQAARDFDGVLHDPRVVALVQDSGFWTAAEAGDLDGALRRPSFTGAAQDPAFRRRLAGLALISDQAARDPQAFRKEMADTLAEVMPRVQALLRDPALQKMLADPELQRRVQQGDSLALLERPELRSLIGRLAAGEGSTPVAPPLR